MPDLEMKVTLGNLANLVLVLAMLGSGVVGYGRLQQGLEDAKKESERVAIERRQELIQLKNDEDTKILALDSSRREDYSKYENQLHALVEQQNIQNQQMLTALQSIQERIDRLLESKRSEVDSNTKTP
jgi:uncharacterized protein HemX